MIYYYTNERFVSKIKNDSYGIQDSKGYYYTLPSNLENIKLKED